MHKYFNYEQELEDLVPLEKLLQVYRNKLSPTTISSDILVTQLFLCLKKAMFL